MVSKNTFGISFFTRKHRGNEKKVPIYARITVDGKRTELSIKMDVDPNNWHKARGSAKGQGDEIKSMNTTLEQIHGRMVECYQELILKKLPVTADNVKNRYLGVEKKEHSLMTVVKNHNQEMKGILERGTLINYDTTERFIELYLEDILKTADISLSHLNYSFLVGFDKYVRDRKPEGKRKPCTNNGAMKHIQRLKKIVNLSIKNEWLDRDPFRKYKLSYIKPNRKFLSEEELAAIEARDYSIERLQQAKDLFVFSCYTGLAYIDSFNLTPRNISRGIDGEYWLSTSRQKTDQQVMILENIRQTEGVKVTLLLVNKVLSVLAEQTHTLIGDEKALLLHNRSGKKHNWKNTYLIARELTAVFDFEKFIEDMSRRINDPKDQSISLNFPSYLLAFYTSDNSAPQPIITEICLKIISQELSVAPNAEGSLILEQNTGRIRTKCIVRLLKHKNRLMTINEMYNIFCRRNPGLFNNEDSLHDHCASISGEKLISSGRFGYGLKKWKKANPVIEGDTIRDIAEEYLRHFNEPQPLEKILSHVKKHQPETTANLILTNLLSTSERFCYYKNVCFGLRKKNF